MQEIINFYSDTENLNEIKNLIISYFKGEDKNKEMNFENYHIIIKLIDFPFSKFITRTLEENEGENLIDLIMFVNDFKDEGINTFISYNKAIKSFELYFSKYYGFKDESIFDDDVKILERNNIKVIYLTERFFGCQKENEIIIKDVEKISKDYFLKKEDYKPEYYKNCFFSK